MKSKTDESIGTKRRKASLRHTSGVVSVTRVAPWIRPPEIIGRPNPRPARAAGVAGYEAPHLAT